MVQRDYEEQPEAPDLGASVQLESEMHLAAPPGDHDGLDAGYVPPDRPYALDEEHVTSRSLRVGDTLDERLARERGEEHVDPDRAGRIVLAGEGAALERPDAMDGVDLGIDGGAASAEEAAVHVVGDPTSLVETEPSLAGAPALDDPELDQALADDVLADEARDAAARDVRADGDLLVPGMPPVAEGVVAEGGATAAQRGGGGLTGDEPDPALPRDPYDSDPAARLDADRDTAGAAAAATGRDDV